MSSLGRIISQVRANKARNESIRKRTTLQDPGVPVPKEAMLPDVAIRAQTPEALLPPSLKIANLKAGTNPRQPKADAYLQKQPDIAVRSAADPQAYPRQYEVLTPDRYSQTKEADMLPTLMDPKVSKWSAEERLQKAFKSKHMDPTRSQMREGSVIAKALRTQIIDDYASQQPRMTAKTIKKLRSEAAKEVKGSEGLKIADDLLKASKDSQLQTNVLNRDSLKFKEDYKAGLRDHILSADPRQIDPEMKNIILDDIEGFSDEALNSVSKTYGRGIKGMKKYEPPSRNAAILGGGKRMLNYLVGDDAYSELPQRERDVMGAELGAIIEEPLLAQKLVEEYSIPLPPSDRTNYKQTKKVVREPTSAQFFDLLEESASNDIGISFTKPNVWKKGRQSGKTLVKTFDNSYLKNLSAKEQPQLFDAVNYIQAVPYRVSPTRLNIFKQLQQQGKLLTPPLSAQEAQHLKELRNNYNRIENAYFEKVNAQHREITATDVSKELKSEAHRELDIRAGNFGDMLPQQREEMIRIQEELRLLNRQHSKSVDENTAIGRAERISEFAEDRPFFFDVQLGDNGRVYYEFPVLNPQGAPVSRNLLEYRDGERLTKDGIDNMKLELASYIEDADLKVAKLPINQRMNWFKENEANIADWSSDPVAYFDDYVGLVDQKSLPSFISALVDYNGWKTDPNFMTHRQSAMDATTSGAQIITALLDDHTIANLVNLVENTDKVGDLYLHSGKEVKKLLSKKKDDGSEMASRALDELEKVSDAGKERVAFKRPLMVIPYGAGGRTISDTLIDDLSEKGFNIDVEAARTIGKTMNNSMTEIIPALGVFKAIIKRLSQKVNVVAETDDAGKATRWEGIEPTFTSTVGFPMKHIKESVYLDEQIKVNQRGERISVYPHKTDKQIGARKKAQSETALMAKFIHFLDANLLMEYTLEMKKRGLPVTVVHDQFGTSVNGASEQLEAIRVVMKKMFGGKNSEGTRLLERVITSAYDKNGNPIWDLSDFEDLIQRGDLDIDETIGKARPFDFG